MLPSAVEAASPKRRASRVTRACATGSSAMLAQAAVVSDPADPSSIPTVPTVARKHPESDGEAEGVGAARKGGRRRKGREDGGGRGRGAGQGGNEMATPIIPFIVSASLPLHAPITATTEDRHPVGVCASAAAMLRPEVTARRPAAPRLAILVSPSGLACCGSVGRVSGHRFSHVGNNEHARTQTQHRPTGLPGTTDAPWHTRRDENGATV